MIKNTRRQLTLFVHPLDAENMEKIRQQYNPLQSKIIKCHVTLCREDEIENITQVLANLKQLNQASITISFGKICRFDNGKGVYLPANKTNLAYHELRKKILHGIIENPRYSMPHITLMHPRNSTCTDTIFEGINKINLPTQLKYNKISLIEQHHDEPWNVLQEFELVDDVFYIKNDNTV